MFSLAAQTMFAATVTIDQINQLCNQSGQIKQVTWEALRMMNYLTWVSVSFYALAVGSSELYTTMVFMIHSITLNYAYEMWFHPPDRAHTVHHSVSLVLQMLWVLTYWYLDSSNPFVYTITLIGHMNNAAMVSSIFSSLRYIIKVVGSRSQYEAATSFYKKTYVVAKVSSGIFQYKQLLCAVLLNHELNLPINTALIISFLILLCLHGIQCYFVYKIVC